MQLHDFWSKAITKVLPLLVRCFFAENFWNVFEQQNFAFVFNVVNILPNHFGSLWVFNANRKRLSLARPNISRFVNTDSWLILFGFFFMHNKFLFDYIEINMAILHEPHQRHSKNVARLNHHMYLLVLQWLFLVNIYRPRTADRLRQKVFLSGTDSRIFRWVLINVMQMKHQSDRVLQIIR